MSEPTEEQQSEEINPLFKLDVVLLFLYIRIGKIFSSDQITEGVSDEIKSDEDEVVLILRKLKKDEYIDEFKLTRYKDTHLLRPTPYEVTGYSINFTGKLFLKQGGYNLENIRLSEQNKKMEKLESDQMAIQTNMQTLTFWIAFGAIVAAAYYLYYLIIPIYDHFFLGK